MEYEPLIGFTGINRNTAPFLTADGEVSNTKNLKTDKIGVLKKTGDYALLGAQIVAGQDILGGGDFFRADGTTHTHVVAVDGASNADIYINVAGTWTAQSQSLTAGNRVRFVYSPTLDTLFAANYADATRSYNGSTWSTSTDVTGAPKAYIPFNFGNRIWLFNAVVGVTAYPTRGYRSSLVDTGTITWDTTNDWVTFDDYIMDVGKVGDNMLVMCANSGYLFNLSDEKYQVTTKGCVSKESVCSYKQFAFWPSQDGIYVLNGSSDQKISLPIQEFWDAIPQANKALIKMKIIGDYLNVYLGDITIGSETYNNVLFQYDILQNDWNKIELQDNVLEMHTFVSSSGEQLFTGNDDGEVFTMFTGSAQNTAEFGSIIESDWFYGSDRKNEDTFLEIWGYGNNMPGLKVSYKVDHEDAKWVSANGELNDSFGLVKINAKAHRIKVIFYESGKNNMYEFYGADIGYNPTESRP